MVQVGENKITRDPLSVGFQEFVSTAPAKRDWLIKGLIPARSIVYISGQEKRAMKTFFALMSATIISTQKAVGLLKPGNISGPILYVLEEGEDAETRERMLAIAKGVGATPNDENFRFMFHARVKLDTDEWRDKILREVRTYNPVAVYLDTMTYMMEGEENSATDANVVIDTIQAIRKEGCAVISLFHLKKSAEHGDDLDNQIRGSGVFPQARDQHLALRRYDRKKAIIHLNVLQRGGFEKEYGVLWDMNNLEMTDEDGDLFHVLDKATPKLLPLSDDRALKAYTVKMAEGELYSFSDLLEMWECSKPEASVLCNALVENGFIEKQKKNVYCLTSDAGAY